MSGTAAVPERIRPMLATLSDRRDFGAGWILERKLDGVRALGFRDGGQVRLASRTGRRLERTYPEIAAALAAQPQDRFAVDGEIVALDARGRHSFERLQRRMQPVTSAGARAVPVVYYLFDLLHLDGYDTTGLPLRSRKELLRRAVDFTEPLRYTDDCSTAGTEAAGALERACAEGWEGLIAKRAEGRYQQRRSADWLKLKCQAGQELVVGGFTEPSGARTGFGALLLGYHDEQGLLRYAGKVGTGFDTGTLRRLRALLDALEQPHPPFADPVRERGAHWVRPQLVAEVGFTEWTRDGRLRHPRFRGLRSDRSAAEVVREPARPER